jgi:hypothetical protein
MKKDIERLTKEWIEHDKIVLAVDYDDTIYHWRHNSEEDCKKVRDLVKWCQTIGAYVMIHSCSDEDRHDELRAFCESKGILVDSINKNPIALPFGHEGKPYYNWQLCDRSGLEYAMKVLAQSAKNVITHKRNKIDLNEIG